MLKNQKVKWRSQKTSLPVWPNPKSVIKKWEREKRVSPIKYWERLTNSAFGRHGWTGPSGPRRPSPHPPPYLPCFATFKLLSRPNYFKQNQQPIDIQVLVLSAVIFIRATLFKWSVVNTSTWTSRASKNKSNHVKKHKS